MGAPRYRDVDTLGEGGMGSVRRVYDEARQQEVALKRMRDLSPRARLRFKREFRAVERLLHPNLVRLYEMGEDADGPYFTMELVEGVELDVYVRGDHGAHHRSRVSTRAVTAGVSRTEIGSAPTLASGRPDATDAPPSEEPLVVHLPAERRRAIERRIAHTFPQILEALSFLHAHGIVHRDLKPGNVLVDGEGTVRLLDFGILASLADPDDEVGAVVGTLGFMAPEQVRGTVPGPAADLYALGATLYAVVSGHPLFEGPAMQQMMAHLHQTPPSLDRVVPGLAPSLTSLCDALLRRDPEDRPSLREVGARLVEIGARSPVLAHARPAMTELHGRDELVLEITHALERSLEGRAQLLVIQGASGTGKTTLSEHVVDRTLRAHGGLVLRGRGRNNDRVAFNALDGVVDQLAMALGRHRRLPKAIRNAAADASQMFPVLADLASASGAPGRRAAFDGVVALLKWVAPAAGLVVSVDDLQWADMDSIALLDHVLRAAPPRVGLIATLRDDVPPGPPRHFVARHDDARVFDLDPLGRDALRRIVRDAALAVGGEPSEADVEAVVDRAAGHPFLAELGGRGLATPSGDPRDASSPVDSHDDLLALSLVADGWTTVAELASLSGRTVGEVVEATRELGVRGVVRLSGPSGAEAEVDLYHDRIRADASERLPASALQSAHGRFADRILAGGLDAKPERLVRHLVGARRGPEAADLALSAARRAEAQLAFSLAADLYAVFLEHARDGHPDAEAANGELARALERSGRYGDAVGAWERVAARTEGTTATLASLRAAQAMMASNDVDEGARRLDRALALAGDRPIGNRSLSALLAGAAFLVGHEAGRLGGAVDARPEVRDKAECDVDLALVVGLLDPLAGVRMLRRARRGFAEVGDAERTMWCDLIFAVFAEVGSGSREPPRLARTYRERAERIAREHGVHSPKNDGLRHFLDALAAFRGGRWDVSIAEMKAAAAAAEAFGYRGRAEHALVLSQLANLQFVRQRPRALAEIVSSLDDVVRDTGDVLLSAYLHLGHAFTALWGGRLPDAQAALDEAIGALPKERPTVQRAATWIYRSQIEIYTGATTALEALHARELAIARSHRLFHGSTRGMYASMVALAHATGLRAGHPMASAKLVRAMAQRAREAPPAGAGDADRALAYLADAEGRPDLALRHLDRAEAEATRYDRPLSAAIARYQIGLRVGGDEGERSCAQARAELAALDAHPLLLDEDPALRPTALDLDALS